MQRTKKRKNKKNTRRSSLLPPGASARGEVPATAAAAPPREARRRRASLGGSPPPPRRSPPLCRASLPRCSLRGGARRRAAPPCRQPAAQLAGRRLCLSGSRGKERGSRGKQRREKTGKGNGEREAPGEKARGDIIMWGPGVDREEAFIRPTAKTVLGG